MVVVVVGNTMSFTSDRETLSLVLLPLPLPLPLLLLLVVVVVAVMVIDDDDEFPLVVDTVSLLLVSLPSSSLPSLVGGDISISVVSVSRRVIQSLVYIGVVGGTTIRVYRERNTHIAMCVWVGMCDGDGDYDG